MDFHELIKHAQQNSSTSKEKGNKYYSTKFEPPKKVTKEKRLSDNIKKFLDQKKREDEMHEAERRQKKLELIAKRDPKVQRKIEKSLKVIKSSKKFYTGDSTLDENTALTLLGQNEQPDEDDYGFASNESDQMYKKLMEKYQKLPEDKKFSSSSRHKALSKEEIHNAKERMKSALATEEKDHFTQGHRQRTSKSSRVEHSSGAGPSLLSMASKPLSADKKNGEKPKPKLKQAPIVDFHALLKLAEQKQHEEVKIEVPTKKEPERLLTSREKREMEEQEIARREREARMKAGNRIPKIGAIPRLSDSKQDKNNNENSSKRPFAQDRGKTGSKLSPGPSKPDQRVPDKFKKPASVANMKTPTAPSSSSKLRDALQKSNGLSKPSTSSHVPTSHKVPQPSTSKAGISSMSKSKDAPTRSISNGIKAPSTSSSDKNVKSRLAGPSKEPQRTREFPPKDLKTREFPPKDLMRTREFPPKDLMRSREFPPKDLARSREFPPRDTKRPLPMSNKRRIEDEDSEYDSEMDDFIDDGDEQLDYSSEIKKIFGYDKARYRDEDYDDAQMESDYRTVMREEFISKKMGLMEDLEDMKMEAEEKKRKEMRMKAMKKRKL